MRISDCPGTHPVGQAGLELHLLLPLKGVLGDYKRKGRENDKGKIIRELIETLLQHLTKTIESKLLNLGKRECPPVCSEKDLKGERLGPLRCSPSECKPSRSSDPSWCS